MEKSKSKNKDCIQKWVWSFYFVRNLFANSSQSVRTEWNKNGKIPVFPMM